MKAKVWDRPASVFLGITNHKRDFFLGLDLLENGVQVWPAEVLFSNGGLCFLPPPIPQEPLQMRHMSRRVIKQLCLPQKKRDAKICL